MIIKQWILNIVSITLIGVLLDIVMPNGNLKKYLRFIIGLVTVIVILNPILNILNKSSQLEKYITSNVFNVNMKSFEYQSKIISETHQYQLKKLFKENMENHITQEIQKLTGYQDIKTQVIIEDINMQNTGKIHKIYMEIGKKEQEIKSVKPVDISVNILEGRNDKQTTKTDIDSSEQSRIKKHISEIYGVEPSKIYISWKDDSD